MRDPATQGLRRAEAAAVAALLAHPQARCTGVGVSGASGKVREHGGGRGRAAGRCGMDVGQLLRAAPLGDEALRLVGGRGADLFRHFSLLVRSSMAVGHQQQQQQGVGCRGRGEDTVGVDTHAELDPMSARGVGGAGVLGEGQGEVVWLEEGWEQLAAGEVAIGGTLLEPDGRLKQWALELLDKNEGFGLTRRERDREKQQQQRGCDGAGAGVGAGQSRECGGPLGEAALRRVEAEVARALLMRRRPMTGGGGGRAGVDGPGAGGKG